MKRSRFEPSASWLRGICSTAVLHSQRIISLTAALQEMSEDLSCGLTGQIHPSLKLVTVWFFGASFRVSGILVRPVLCSFKWNNRRLWRMSKMEIIKGLKSWMKVGKTLEYWEWTNKKLFTLSLIKSSGFIFTIKWQLPKNSFPSRTNEWTNIFMPQLTLIASNCWIIIAIKSQTMRLHP